MISTLFEWRVIFIVMALYSLIIFVLYLFLLPETHQSDDQLAMDLPKIMTYYKTIISHPTFLGYVLCSIFMIAGESAFNTAVAVFADENIRCFEK